MGFGLSFKVAPGVRIRASSRGIRTSVGPRAARVHIGAGRTTLSDSNFLAPSRDPQAAVAEGLCECHGDATAKRLSGLASQSVGGPLSSSWRKPSSSRIGTPSSTALSYFEPGESPATT
jgi:hypothetical protein